MENIWPPKLDAILSLDIVLYLILRVTINMKGYSHVQPYVRGVGIEERSSFPWHRWRDVMHINSLTISSQTLVTWFSRSSHRPFMTNERERMYNFPIFTTAYTLQTDSHRMTPSAYQIRLWWIKRRRDKINFLLLSPVPLDVYYYG